jgi:hypothetical protein
MVKDIFGGIWMILIFYGLYRLATQSDRKRRRLEAERESIRKAARDFIKSRHEEIIKYAISHKKIGIVHYDIEEGGTYHSKPDPSDVKRINQLIEQYLIEFPPSDTTIDTNPSSQLEPIKKRILTLSDRSETYVGF